MSEIGAAGDIVTGGLIARAVEPGHGEGGTAHGDCANCGTALHGEYCHACGQRAHLHRTIGGIGHEIVHGVFHFEGKIWRTLPLLVWRPGELTRRYIHGERARFVSPMALFLFSVFLMFAIVSAIAGDMHAPEVAQKWRGKSIEQLQVERNKYKAVRDRLRTQRDALRAADRDAEAQTVKTKIDAINDEISAIDTARAFVSGNGGRIGNFETGSPRLNDALKKANDNPNLLLYKLQTSAYKFSWALIPLSAPFLWLLFFWRRDLKMYDHAIFVIYSLSFMSLLVVVLTVLGALNLHTAIISTAAMLIPPWHMYRQLRGAYLCGRWGALARTLALLNFALVALVFFAVGLLFLGLLG